MLIRFCGLNLTEAKVCLIWSMLIFSMQVVLAIGFEIRSFMAIVRCNYSWADTVQGQILVVFISQYSENKVSQVMKKNWQNI